MNTTLTQNQSSTAFQLKGSLFTLTVMQIISCDLMLIGQQLESTISKTPKFFHHAPIVIDLSLLPAEEEINLAEVNKLLIQHSLIPVGIRSTNELQQEAAKKTGLAILPTSISNESKTNPRPASASTADKLENSGSLQAKVIDQPVRSGQQIYARNSDLIIMASVSTGAEILADGNIHVYGALRGRALAGILGNVNTHIFCKSLEAELISIAGRYLLNENLTGLNQSGYTHIYLDGEHLQIRTI